jgi:glycosyltransferase involved in cell wall biosynthesis
MTPISVVIISKNEVGSISRCIKAAKLISDDIIVVDNDSNDDTARIAITLGCRVYHEFWDGYGANKNKGIAYARHNWILSIDADEIADEALVRSIHELKLDNAEIVYDIPFITYFGNKPIRFGSWGRDHHIRLFNRKLVRWTEPPVHEKLILPPVIPVKKLKGHLHHYSVKDSVECNSKTIHYAKLSAEKYLFGGEKATWVKLYLSPAFHFVKNYFVLLGFMDGSEGWEVAKMISRHTRLKYRMLRELSRKGYQLAPPQIKDKLVVEY